MVTRPTPYHPTTRAKPPIPDVSLDALKRSSHEADQVTPMSLLARKMIDSGIASIVRPIHLCLCAEQLATSCHPVRHRTRRRTGSGRDPGAARADARGAAGT